MSRWKTHLVHTIEWKVLEWDENPKQTNKPIFIPLWNGLNTADTASSNQSINQSIKMPLESSLHVSLYS